VFVQQQRRSHGYGNRAPSNRRCVHGAQLEETAGTNLGEKRGEMVVPIVERRKTELVTTVHPFIKGESVWAGVIGSPVPPQEDAGAERKVQILGRAVDAWSRSDQETGAAGIHSEPDAGPRALPTREL